MFWFGVTSGTLIVLAFVLRRALRRSMPKSHIDVGNVSDNWLAEERGRKD